MDRSIELYKVVKAHFKYKPYTIGVKKTYSSYVVTITYSVRLSMEVYFPIYIIHHFLDLTGREREQWRDYINAKLDITVFEHMELPEVF